MKSSLMLPFVIALALIIPCSIAFMIPHKPPRVLTSHPVPVSRGVPLPATVEPSAESEAQADDIMNSLEVEQQQLKDPFGTLPDPNDTTLKVSREGRPNICSASSLRSSLLVPHVLLPTPPPFLTS
jgi:hypothetical protein